MSKTLTREDILSVPDAPAGERGCDTPLDADSERWVRQFLRVRELLHAATRDLVADGEAKTTDWWRRALEVLKVTGLPPTAYSLLSTVDEVHVTRAAAQMKREERTALLDVITAAAAVMRPPTPELTIEDTALALLAGGHTVTQIAKRLGKTKQALYKRKTYPRLAAALNAKRGGACQDRQRLPRGTKSGTGDIEAWKAAGEENG